MATDRDVQSALSRLDGTPSTAVQLLTGLTAAELDELGGLPDTTD